jgi:hypothetical protein
MARQSEYIREWPEDKLTVAELRAIVQHDQMAPEYRTGKSKMRAALDKVEESTCWVIRRERYGYLKKVGTAIEWADDLDEAQRFAHKHEAAAVIRLQTAHSPDHERWWTLEPVDKGD